MYMQKNEIFLNFVRGMGGFEGIEWMDSENYSKNAVFCGEHSNYSYAARIIF